MDIPLMTVLIVCRGTWRSRRFCRVECCS